MPQDRHLVELSEGEVHALVRAADLTSEYDIKQMEFTEDQQVELESAVRKLVSALPSPKFTS